MDVSPKYRRRVVLVFAPSSRGGIAEHTKRQAEALRRADASVIFLGASETQGPDTVVCLPETPPRRGRLRLAWAILWSRWVLVLKILRHRPDLVLLDSYVEYLSPLWIWPHWLLAKRGVRYAANLHDPVRDFVLGPLWWHKLSVDLAYKPLEFVLVHDRLSDPSIVPSHVRVIQAPHGIFEAPAGSAPEPMRKTWGVRSGQKVFLAFGHVRDKKNLDLVIRAMTRVPEMFLVVAGSLASSKDKPLGFYQQLACELGVRDRCHFVDNYVPQAELGNYFGAADFVLLTYSAGFHSQSGVLQLAVHARKPVLASSSPSAMTESVTSYRLGVVVPPDSQQAIVEGVAELLVCPPIPEWEAYVKLASWDINAAKVLEALG